MSVGNDNPTDDQSAIVVADLRNRPTDRGLVLVWADGQPRQQVRQVPPNRAIKIGRSATCDLVVEDGGVSREHVEVTFDGVTWRFRDLGGSNGTYVDGERVDGAVVASSPRCLRLGKTAILAPVADAIPYAAHRTRVEGGLVLGPLLQDVYSEIDQLGRISEPLLIRGESGTGKADAAARYARACGRALYDVNVVLASANLAPATLFGAKKGAYSGSDANREGWFDAANGKVLFLDEIGELPMDVQPLLLHAVETGRIMAVGSTVARQVDVRLVAATHVDLEAAVRAGRFRNDLLRRIEKRSVRLPSLRERAADVPHMVKLFLTMASASEAKAELPPTGALLEACMLAEWPGNMRQLQTAIAKAFRMAWTLGDDRVGLGHCAEILEAEGAAPPQAGEEGKMEAFRRAWERTGSVAAAMKEVGVKRSTAYYWVKGWKG